MLLKIIIMCLKSAVILSSVLKYVVILSKLTVSVLISVITADLTDIQREVSEGG